MDRASAFMRLFLSDPRRTSLRRVAFQMHLYAGLGVAIMMMAMGLSGSAIALREPIQFALHRRPEAVNVISASDISIDRSLRTFSISHPDRGIASLRGFERQDGLLAIQTKAKMGGPDRFFFIDRHSGLQVLSHERLSATLDFLDDFHRNLLVGRKGRAINGIVAVLFCLTTLTGAVVWWPGASRWTRSLFVNPNLSWKRINYDLHSATGFYCFLYLLVMSISAVALATPSLPDLLRGGKSGGDREHHHHGHAGNHSEEVAAPREQVGHDAHRGYATAHSRNDIDALLTTLPGLVRPSWEKLRAIELDNSGVPSRLEFARGRPP
jgi:uncharacterized iron-regulated membrane protein